VPRLVTPDSALECSACGSNKPTHPRSHQELPGRCRAGPTARSARSAKRLAILPTLEEKDQSVKRQTRRPSGPGWCESTLGTCVRRQDTPEGRGAELLFLAACSRPLPIGVSRAQKPSSGPAEDLLLTRHRPFCLSCSWVPHTPFLRVGLGSPRVTHHRFLRVGLGSDLFGRPRTSWLQSYGSVFLAFAFLCVLCVLCGKSLFFPFSFVFFLSFSTATLPPPPLDTWYTL
jgi:hypothetical protein